MSWAFESYDSNDIWVSVHKAVMTVDVQNQGKLRSYYFTLAQALATYYECS